MTTAHNGSAPRFQRTRSGYDPVAVNHYIAELVLRQQAQHCEIETLKAEIASLKDENAALKDTSPSTGGDRSDGENASTRCRRGLPDAVGGTGRGRNISFCG